MEFRKFPHSGEKISVLGMGCMRLPVLNSDNSTINEAATEEMIDIAIKSGVNYFDTAYAYHGGNSETVLGKILKKYDRNSIYIADKMPLWYVKKQEDVERIFNEQLERLQTDYFDFYLLHGFRSSLIELVDNFKIYDFIKEKQKEGKVKYIGFSFHDTPEALEKIINKYDFQFAQIQYNYFDHYLQKAKEQYDILTKAKIPVVIMEPVRGGFLASANQITSERMKQAHEGWSVASWAMRYAIAPDNVLCVLSGMSSKEQLIDNINTASDGYDLTEDDYKIIHEAYENIIKYDIVPCTQCRYCMDCPAGVEIPEVLKLHNAYIMSSNALEYRNAYKGLTNEKNASACIGCTACEELCPQKIEISKQMERIKEFWGNRNV